MYADRSGALPVRPKAAILLMLTVLAGCDSDPTGPNVQDDSCTTEISAGSTGTFVELCALEGGARHVVIEDFSAAPTHQTAQILFGFDAAPSSPTPDLDADQFQLLFYGGGTPFPAALAQAGFGDVEAVLGEEAGFINAGATICFDLYDGSATAGPEFILWVEGQGGADCSSPATLTVASAYDARASWQGAQGAIAKSAKMYFRQSGAGAPRVTLYKDAVLSAAEIAAATTCTTTWATNTDWQPLCEPAVGSVRHVRIEGPHSTANSSYFYAVLGQAANPTGSPAPSAGKLIVTGGRNHAAASWTWFRFDDGTTTQYTYATTGGDLYLAGPAEICFDLGRNDGSDAALVFWATGAEGANCSDPGTLTLDNALYDSATDPTTANIWDAPLNDALNFIKTSNPNVSLGEVVIFSEPAAL